MEDKRKVLIVEDDKLLALVEERLVERLGFEVVGTAVTGEEAIALVKDSKPDIILMDISLKGDMDGIDAVEKIRKYASTPVIYLSGNSDKFNFERAKKTGFVDYLVKPVTADDLVGPLKNAVAALASNGVRKSTGKSSGKSVSQAG
jgi:two-component system, response regulator PdtaR